MMIVTASYCWHVFLTVIFLLIELKIAKIIYKLFKNISIELDDLIDIKLQNNDSDNHYTCLNNWDIENKRLTLNNSQEDETDETETVIFENDIVFKKYTK
jgi:hypothetical protein